ncbi:MAG: lipid-A-disaccharide synthase, partial [Cyanobacteria bacterium]|nr:lipid-A-disaccharide synthase [Cyanobacteriota bacterium]MDW8201442.1 lipid-A-disaccharide synthase [Cyanobacteriota bacterium SKYGB_h_bin112]
VIGKRLGYRIVVYAEWEARWYGWVDRFGVMNAATVNKIPQPYTYKATIVGDLMTEVAAMVPDAAPTSARSPTIGLLPGSKAHKLKLGVPFMLAMVSYIRRSLPNVRFVLPVAPTVTCDEIAQFARADHNSCIRQFGWAEGELARNHDRLVLRTHTDSGTIDIELYEDFPAYHVLAQCDACVTTVGANTAELGALAVPMVVVIPTQQMDVMKTWDGLPGIIANLPLVGSGFATLFNWYMGYRLGVFGSSKRRTLFAWPNIWAGEEIVPELVGRLQPVDVANRLIDWLTHPEALQQVRDRLRSVRGDTGAASKLVAIVVELLP